MRRRMIFLHDGTEVVLDEGSFVSILDGGTLEVRSSNGGRTVYAPATWLKVVEDPAEEVAPDG